MSFAQLFQQLVFVLSASSLVACDGSGSGSVFNSPANDGTASQQTAPLQNVNGALRGTYFSSGLRGEGDWLNLQTGEAGAFYESGAGADAIAPAQDGTEYLELYVDDRTASFGSISSTVAIKDMRTGLVTDQFTVPGEINENPRYLRFSPDRQIIAVLRDLNDDFDYNLSFFTRTGELIATFADESVSEFDWLPDGRFGYFKAEQLLIGALEEASGITGRVIASVSHIVGGNRIAT